MRQDSGSNKRPRTQPNLQFAPAAETLPLTGDEKSEFSSKKCSKCSVLLEPTAESCSKCGGGIDEGSEPAPASEKRPFKPYANIRSPSEKTLYETLAGAFSEMDPRQRPWCGIGLEPGLLAVSPTSITVADLREVNGVEEGVVQIPRNWREPWHVQTTDGARHQMHGDPCDKAERAISTIKATLRSSSGDEPTLPCIKYLITFPDIYEISGPKEFSILEAEHVLTLRLRSFRGLAEAILEPTQQERLDSRKYRRWIEDRILLRKNDDSIVGTWLDPAFDKIEATPPKSQRWPFRHIRHQNVPAEEHELSPSDTPGTRLGETKFKWRKSKVTLIVIPGILIGMIAWRIYDATKPLTAVSDSSLPSAPDPETSIGAAEVLQTTSQLLVAENENRDIVPATEVGKSSEVQKPEPTANDQVIASARKPRDRTRDAEDSELKRQKMELQVQEAIRLRAITGVTVYFVGETAYLGGQVGTENQKSAAEKAARTVSGVKKVQNSIKVNLLPPTDG